MALRKADLHVHSKYSIRPSEWILRKIGTSESYTEPARLYEIAKERGMDFVTITDHNTLAGSLEIAHLENTFVSEEITTYFPEDRCKLHVLAYGVTEAHHEEITRFRENVFELVAYLNQEGIVHALAHPLFAVNDRLTRGHLCQVLVLFKNFEMNGSRDDYQNHILQQILDNLTQKDLEFLENETNLQPSDPEPWVKNTIGGSDDHSSLNIARTYTEMEGVSTVVEFLEGITQERSRVRGRTSNPKSMGHNLYSIAYQFYNAQFNLEGYHNKELLLRFVDRALTPPRDAEEGFMDRLKSLVGYRRPRRLFLSKPKTMQDLILKEARDIILEDPQMSKVVKENNLRPWEMEEVWFRFVNQISDEILSQLADSTLKGLSGVNVFDIFHTMGSAGSLYTMLAPYFISYTIFVKDRRLCRDFLEFFEKEPQERKRERLKIAHFTDTYYDVNGVALTLQMQIRMARKNKKQQTIITCGPELNAHGVTNFAPIGTFEIPEYPDMKLHYPPLLKMLNYCYEEDFTHIHSATPGPIGLAALAIARILKLPLYGTYHTSLPQYTERLTDDPAMEEIMWRYSLWYYNQMDAVYVPSKATGEELASKGIPKHKIRFYDRGIDVDRFHPSKRNGFFKKRYGVAEGTLKLLYVGRISKEKNLPQLIEIFKRLVETGRDIHMVVAGSGPFLGEMEENLRGMPATFTGFIEGETLAQAYASSDLFIFPSTTDTFGNVVLEAQASGLPVIVTDKGGPKENLIHGKTGFIVPSGDAGAFVDAVTKLIDNRGLLEGMKRNAREYMENRSFEASYMRLWDSYRIDGAQDAPTPERRQMP